MEKKYWMMNCKKFGRKHSYTDRRTTPTLSGRELETLSQARRSPILNPNWERPKWRSRFLRVSAVCAIFFFGGGGRPHNNNHSGV